MGSNSATRSFEGPERLQPHTMGSRLRWISARSLPTIRPVRFLIPPLAVALNLALVTPILARGQICVGGDSGAAIDCSGDLSSSIVPVNHITAGSTSSTSTSSGSNIRYIPYDRVTADSNGQPCITTGYYAAGSQPNDAVGLDPATQNVRDIHGLSPLEYPPCPAQPAAPGQPPALTVDTPSMVARRYWEQVRLPTPRPTIAPGRAITGKLAYLETRGEITRTYTNDTVFGPLRIEATGAYTVAWGDGETTGPHRFEGTPWPSGQITHTYLTVGVYDIVVTEKWTATWTLGGERGILRTLQTTGRIDNFPVEQIQALVGR